MNKGLLDQTVVVFGGSSGIGEAVCQLAREAGARVVALSRSGRAPPGVQGVAVDANEPTALGAALLGIGPIHHLVHTIGMRLGATPLASLETETLRLAFDAKLFGALQAIRAALPQLVADASITLTSGQVSRKYGVGSLVKGSLNAAVDAAGRHLAKELAPRRVNVVSPGVVNTALWGESGSPGRLATLERVAATLPVKRVAQPHEVAQAYLFAMGNGFVTGAVIDVDGGGLL